MPEEAPPIPRSPGADRLSIECDTVCGIRVVQ